MPCWPFFPVRGSSEAFSRELGQSERIVEFPEGKETRVGGDL